MQKIILVAESGSDVPQDLAERYNIWIVPMHVSFGDTVKDDGSFPSEEICRFYDSTGILPRSSCSVPWDFEQAFDKIHSLYPDSHILHLAYSAVTTGSYANAVLASKGRDYVTSLDTRFASAGQGIIVVKMAQLLEEHPEWDLNRALEVANILISHCRMCFTPSDMEYPRAGGRVSNAVALCGNLLNIHPLIEMLEGKLVVTKKKRGKMERLVPALVESYARKNDLDHEELWMIRTPFLPDSIVESAEEKAHSLGYKKVQWVHSGGVITIHGGPGAFGLVGFSTRAAGENAAGA